MLEDELMRVRDRARQGLSLTGRQARALAEDRDAQFKMYLGSQHALSGLRPFMAEDAPEWARERVKTATNTNAGVMAEYQAFVEEVGNA